MSEQPRQTWDEMKKLYPNQWLQIVDFETDKYGEVTVGIVMGHSPITRDLPAPPSDRGIVAFEYTGESTFTGGLRHFADNNHL